MQVEPVDEHNRLLIEHAHPNDWQNPVPASRYNLVAIGGGTAGLVSAIGTAGLGGKAALVERHLLGGDCLNYGCVPSKALIRAARAAYHVQSGAKYGCLVGDMPVRVDFASVMERMRRLRAGISHHDSAQRLSALGVDVYLGTARFTGSDTLDVDGQELRFRSAVIATGARAADPNIAGLAEVGYLTNETVFSLTELPHRLIVVGAGPIGSELAQAFRRFGSEVHLVGRGASLLAKEDADAAAIVQQQFEAEGIHLHLGWEVERAEKMGDSKSIVIAQKGERRKLIADAILVAVGRQPNIEGLGLDAAGVKYSNRGVDVDDRLRTSNRRVYAAGDICSKYKFTHAADAMARNCIQNALFLGRKRASDLIIPRCTYTDPEIAHVGLTREEAQEQNVTIDTYRVGLADVDRAVLDGEHEGFAAIHTRRGSGHIVGATIVAAHAGEMISEITLLMNRKLSLGKLASVIHCYPTQAEAWKRLADEYQRTRLTPGIAKLFRSWLAWQR